MDGRKKSLIHFWRGLKEEMLFEQEKTMKMTTYSKEYKTYSEMVSDCLFSTYYM